MKYKLNKLEPKTTNHFNINDISIDIEIPKFQMNSDFQIEGDTSSIKIDKKLVNKKYSSKIGLELDSYYQLSITVLKNINIENPIIIKYQFNKNDSLYDNIIINYEENSSCDFIIEYSSKDNSSNFHHLLETCNASKNSSGNITLINLLNSSSKQFISIEGELLNGSNITHNIIDLDGSIRLYNYYSNSHDNSKNYLNTIYIGKDNSILDYNYYLKVIGIDSFNNMKVEGVLDDYASKKFRGTIDFIAGCSRSIGEENENCVLLSDNCISRSLPQMLCGEENVYGTHGVSSGKVSQEKLFYLMSRGYNKKEAEKLIIMGNFQKILESIPKDISSLILDRIDNII